jgi:C-terminal processing protease CtpA/Prc
MTFSKHAALLPTNSKTEQAPLSGRLSTDLTKRSALFILGMAITLLLSACGSGGSGGVVQQPTIPQDDDPLTSASCETSAQNQWVYNNMLDYYLFYDQVPQLDPQVYESPEALLRAARFEERDPYSHLTNADSSSLQFDEGRSFGLGFRWGRDLNDAPRLINVIDDSPFGKAGLERGDIIVSVNGTPWYEYSVENFVNNVIGSPEAPATSMWQIENRDSGETFDVEITTAEYAINTVLHKQFFTNPSYSGTVGYLAFGAFLDTSRSELNTVFQEFSDNNITDLVLDLRYNGGGRVSIAEHLASLIAGNSRANELLYQYEFNNKYSANNYSLRLQNNVGDLGLSRVIILTRGNTASASEIVIGGLQPHMEVVTIGTTTSGKPYIQRGRDRCGSRLNAIEAEGVNAAGVSVFGGVTAACYASDDRTRNYGIDVETGKLEGMLESALDYIVFGSCETLLPKSEQSAGKLVAIDENEKQGFNEIVGAFR